MGGFGSGRQRMRRAVEECPGLDVAVVAEMLRGCGSARCLFVAERKERAIWIAARAEDDGLGFVEMEWHGRRGTPRREVLRIAASYPTMGGVRWWWECPALWWRKWETEHPWEHCARRVGKLYLRKGRWACRVCHGLTYLSCRKGRGNDE
jgi:hypothetical protein